MEKKRERSRESLSAGHGAQFCWTATKVTGAAKIPRSPRGIRRLKDLGAKPDSAKDNEKGLDPGFACEG